MADDLFDVEHVSTSTAGSGAESATPDSIVLRCFLEAGPGRPAVAGRRGDALHVRLAPSPVDGRANVALVELVATIFAVDASRVTIASGERARLKRVRVEGVGADEARRRLDEAIAQAARPSGASARRGR